MVSADHRALQDVSSATFPLPPHPGAAGHRSAYMTCSPTLTTGDYTHYLTSKQSEEKLKAVTTALFFVSRQSVSLVGRINKCQQMIDWVR